MSEGNQEPPAEGEDALGKLFKAFEKAGREEDVESSRKLVHFRRVLAPTPQQASDLEGPYKFNALALALHSLGRALERAGQPLAAHARAESRSLRCSIGLAEIEG